MAKACGRRNFLAVFIISCAAINVLLVDGYTFCTASDRDLEKLWSPMVNGIRDYVEIFVRLVGSPAPEGSSNLADCAVAEWNHPDSEQRISRRGEAGGIQLNDELPSRGPAIVFCSLYGAFDYANVLRDTNTVVRIHIGSGVYAVGKGGLPQVLRRQSSLHIVGADWRGRIKFLPSFECAGEAEDTREEVPFMTDVHRKINSNALYNQDNPPIIRGGLTSFSGGDQPGTGVGYALTTIFRGFGTVKGKRGRGNKESIAVDGIVKLAVGAKVKMFGIAFVGGEAVRGGAITLGHHEEAAEAANYGSDISTSTDQFVLLMHQGGMDPMEISRLKRLLRSEDKTWLHTDQCDFMDNGAVYGGAIYIGTGVVNLTRSHFVGNMARRCGGALYYIPGFTDIIMDHTIIRHNQDRCGDVLSQIPGPSAPRAFIPILDGANGPQTSRQPTVRDRTRSHGLEELKALGAGPPTPGSTDARGVMGMGDPITDRFAEQLRYNRGLTGSIGGGYGAFDGNTGMAAKYGLYSLLFQNGLLALVPTLASASSGTIQHTILNVLEATVGALLILFDSLSFVTKCAVVAGLVFLWELYVIRPRARRRAESAANKAANSWIPDASQSFPRSKKERRAAQRKVKKRGKSKMQVSARDSDSDMALHGIDDDGDDCDDNADDDGNDTDWGPLYTDKKRGSGNGARRRNKKR